MAIKEEKETLCNFNYNNGKISPCQIDYYGQGFDLWKSNLNSMSAIEYGDYIGRTFGFYTQSAILASCQTRGI